ncbi:ARM repeat-containing protein [Xylariaceae sp. FL0804]|nr:ARM repeat-containing protein [Xylariaceae sp. FL0804]
MPQPRSKRQAIRDERKAKRREKSFAGAEANKSAKRQRLNQDAPEDNGDDDVPAFADGHEEQQGLHQGRPDREFFGMLSDEEQEYFRSVDEQLDIDDFPSQEERQLYLANVFAEAQGKELKLACSQSCSRLMERLVEMADTRQKKKIFMQFGGHFLGLIQHRFASHCCEKLFLQSAPVVTRELGGERDDAPAEDEEADKSTLPYMEELFLFALDELDGQLSYLLTDRFASHTLRVLLIILSGRPLEESHTRSLIHSKKKEKISAPWKFNSQTESSSELRAVPSSFNIAAKKVIADSVSGMGFTELRVLAKHPTGNPVLQLLLELDISLNSKAGDDSGEMTLLWALLPGAPNTLKDATSQTSDFVYAMLYDPIGSRLLETLVTHCPGKLFKVLYKHVFAVRINSLLRNDIACYPAIRALNRLSKEDLAAAVTMTLPEMNKLVSLSRFNVIKTLFERCHVRQATGEVEALTRALVEACDSESKLVIPRLCLPQRTEGLGGQDPLSKNRSALVSHGSHLATAMLTIPGPPRNTIQDSISSLSEEQVLEMATSSAPTAHVLTDALSTPSENKIFHKALVAAIRPNTIDLATSEHGCKVLSSIASVPSRSEGISLPFHIKESILSQLGERESELRESNEGRRVWRSWRGDLWKTRRADWVAWAKEVDSLPAPLPSSEKQQVAGRPKHGKGTNANSTPSASTYSSGSLTKKRKAGRTKYGTGTDANSIPLASEHGSGSLDKKRKRDTQTV